MKKPFLILILIVVFGAVFYIWKPDFRNVRTSDVLTLNGREISIEVADTPAKQAQGLSGREGLGQNEGMLFIFPEHKVQNFWMKDMKFPIDIIWISGDWVVGFVENAPVPVSENSLIIYSSPETVDKVLEINAGLIKKWNIKVGDLINFL